MNTRKIEGKIVFYYPHADLFDDVQHLSAYMCKNIVTKEGGDLSDNYAITDDEQPVFDVYLRETLPNVYEAVKPLTHGIDDAIVDSMTAESLAEMSGLELEDEGNYVVIITQDHEAYNPNDIKIADTALQSAIEQGVIAEYYARVLNKDLTEMSMNSAAAALTVLAKRLLPLRRRSRVY